LTSSLLDDGSGIPETLSKNNARWHKSCRDQFNSTKLQRAQRKKRKRISSDEAEVVVDPSPKKRKVTRSQCGSRSEYNVCFLCNQNGNKILWSVHTTEVNTRVLKCATILNDTMLLAKLAGTDLISLEAKYHNKCLIYLYQK